ncbi:hypothetical protein Mpt1_c08460 [Candidatus Methanoplasma termitum]|uniref:Uncharacterized protein n=1 Tax=Candidatus Methanoplasma termitum TaxID=1577791 RepID=A0A0A7LEI7_9ARCH|nr:hypothetical protein Mpt1_c08460 [Candidatus Methanoplasma termitum]
MMKIILSGKGFDSRSEVAPIQSYQMANVIIIAHPDYIVDGLKIRLCCEV